MTTEELQAEVTSLTDKLKRSQDGREADNRAAEAKLASELAKQAKTLSEQWESHLAKITAEVDQALLSRSQAYEADKAAALQKLTAEANAAMQAQADSFKALLTAAEEKSAALTAQVATLTASVAKYKAAAEKLAREALARAQPQDADDVIAAALKG